MRLKNQQLHLKQVIKKDIFHLIQIEMKKHLSQDKIVTVRDQIQDPQMMIQETQNLMHLKEINQNHKVAIHKTVILQNLKKQTKGHKMKIKKILVKDCELYHALRLKALKECPEAFSSSYEEEVDMSIDSIQKRLRHKDYVTLGAYDNDQLVGMVTLLHEPRKKTKQNGRIVSMFVDANYRKQGVGHKLLDKIIAKARDKKIENLFLTVTKENYLAINLYQHYGFVTYGVEKRAIKIDDTYYDNNLMGLYL